MTSGLADAIIALLPHVRAVLAAHDPGSPARCRSRTSPCAECSEFWLAADALELVIRARRSGRKPSAGPADTAQRPPAPEQAP